MMDKYRRYLWAYGLEALPSAMRCSFAGRVAKEYGITDLFLSMSGTLSPMSFDEGLLADVIIDVRPLAVHAMVFQDSFYLDFSAGIENEILGVVRKLNNYNLSHWNSRIMGIHLDVEPHARAEYQAGVNNMGDDNLHSLVSRYIGLLKCIRSQIDLSLGLCEQDFIFSAATGWWYETRLDATMAILCRDLDAIVPMAYNSAEVPVGGSLERMKGKLPYAKWESEAPPGARFIVGLGFCEYESIADVADPLQQWLSATCARSFGGVAFFSSYDILIDEERRIIEK